MDGLMMELGPGVAVVLEFDENGDVDWNESQAIALGEEQEEPVEFDRAS